MSDTSRLKTCQMVCWGLAGLTGFMVFLSATRGMGLIAGVLLGVAFAAVIGIGMRKLVCTDYPDDDRGIEGGDIVRMLRNVTGITGYKAPPDQASAMDLVMGAKPAGAPRAPAAPPAPAPDAPSPAGSAKPSGGSAASVKSGTVLAGEQELADRKGNWRYDADDAPKNGEASASVDDTIGTRPPAVSAPKAGQADDLKQLKGVGPKLEQLCNEFGIYHFEQIAAWGPDEVAWADENLVGFKGRVSRDNWVDQAKSLAAGENS